MRDAAIVGKSFPATGRTCAAVMGMNASVSLFVKSRASGLKVESYYFPRGRLRKYTTPCS